VRYPLPPVVLGSSEPRVEPHAGDCRFQRQGAVWTRAPAPLAHDRALATYSGTPAAIRSQYSMLAVMVGFTSPGLYLLSEAA
jgi:hypothetical protein